MEFADEVVRERGKDYDDVVYLTGLYNRLRFGGRPPAGAEHGRIKEIIGKLKQL